MRESCWVNDFGDAEGAIQWTRNEDAMTHFPITPTVLQSPGKKVLQRNLPFLQIGITWKKPTQ